MNSDEKNNQRDSNTRKPRVDAAKREKYSRFNPAYLFLMQQIERSTINLLLQQGISSIDELKILEIGCGSGGILLDFQGFGADTANLFGIDISLERLGTGHQRNPGFNLAGADGGCLPFRSDSFDLVLQYTAFTSMLDAGTRVCAAQEMMRVVKKPNGLIVWYDFWINPTNLNTHPIRPAEIRNLFPECNYDFHKVTLAPPISRRIVPISWVAALILEKFKVFNSHQLVAIRPSDTRQ
jgi:ubiquinone/menaquinone biosynthesis C-methylase UbiE